MITSLVFNMAQYEVTAQHPNKDAQQTVEDKTRKFRKNKKTERQTWQSFRYISESHNTYDLKYIYTAESHSFTHQ